MAYRLLALTGLFGWPHLDLHKRGQGADAQDADLRVCVRVLHAALRIGGIVVLGPIVKNPDRRQARNGRQYAIDVQVI